MKKGRWKNQRIYAALVIAALVITGIMTAFYLISRLVLKAGQDRPNDQKLYDYHVAVITGNPKDVFWETFFAAVRQSGEENQMLVENFGSELNQAYSEAELLQMAIASKVDGIIIEADATEEMRLLIDQADAAGIAVLTVGTDAKDSARKSFVSANDYALGEMYGHQILGLAEAEVRRVTVLLPTDNEHAQPNLVYSGINEILQGSGNSLQLSALLTGQHEEFEAEERIRDLLLAAAGRPDIIVCLNAVDTISTYQCLVDYNLVGQVKVIGSFYSPEILEGIQKGIIHSTVATNAQEMGTKAAEGLYQYLTEQYVSGYFAIESELITAENVDSYQEKA